MDFAIECIQNFKKCKYEEICFFAQIYLFSQKICEFIKKSISEVMKDTSLCIRQKQYKN